MLPDEITLKTYIYTYIYIYIYIQQDDIEINIRAVGCDMNCLESAQDRTQK
jgi:hypothetical protein